jgi:hypothetical protein
LTPTVPKYESQAVNELDLLVRRLTYQLFVDLGRAPSVDEVAAVAAVSPPEAVAAWHRLHDQHAIVLEPSGRALRMANPFFAVETTSRARCRAMVVCELRLGCIWHLCSPGRGRRD